MRARYGLMVAFAAWLVPATVATELTGCNDGSTGCCMVCNGSCACGNSCISCSTVCTLPKGCACSNAQLTSSKIQTIVNEPISEPPDGGQGG